MVTAGLFRHYKGNAYRVLFVARWVAFGKQPTPDAELLIVARPGPAVQLVSSGLYGEPLFKARWSGNTNEAHEGDAIVIYVALYGEGRVAARHLDEFEEVIDTGVAGIRRARFERIGD